METARRVLKQVAAWWGRTRSALTVIAGLGLTVGWVWQQTRFGLLAAGTAVLLAGYLADDAGV